MNLNKFLTPGGGRFQSKTHSFVPAVRQSYTPSPSYHEVSLPDTGGGISVPSAAISGSDQKTTTLRDLVGKASLVVTIAEAIEATLASKNTVDSIANLLRVTTRIPNMALLQDATKDVLVKYATESQASIQELQEDVKKHLDDLRKTSASMKEEIANLKTVSDKVNALERLRADFSSRYTRAPNYAIYTRGFRAPYAPTNQPDQATILADFKQRVDISIDEIHKLISSTNALTDGDLPAADISELGSTIAFQESLKTFGKKIAKALSDSISNAEKVEKNLSGFTLRSYRAAQGQGVKGYDMYLSADELVSNVKTPLSATIDVVRTNLDKLKGELSGIISKQSKKTADPATVEMQQHLDSVEAVYASLQSLQYLSLSLDTNEILQKLKAFLGKVKDRHGVLDKLSVEKVNSYTAVAPKEQESILDKYRSDKVKVPVRQSTWAKKPENFLFRTIDNDQLELYVEQMTAFCDRVMADETLGNKMEDANKQLMDRLTELDKSIKSGTGPDDGEGGAGAGSVASKQSVRDLKLNAIKAYISTMRQIINDFANLNVRFLLEQHRDALSYIMYWDEKMQVNKDIGDSVSRSFVKNYVDTRNKLVEFIKQSVVDKVLSDANSTASIVLKPTEGSVRFDEKKEREVFKLFEEYSDWAEKRGMWIINVHLNGTLTWVDVLMSQVFLVSYAIKLVRIVLMWLSLRIAYSIFQQKMQSDPLASYSRNPPSPLYFLAAFFLLDAAMNCGLLLVLLLASWLMSSPADPLIERNLWVAIIIDYAASFVVMSVVSVAIAMVIKDKRFFRYRYDPSTGVRALKDLMFNAFVVILMIPFFRLGPE
jgi:hypothetical protein